MTPGFILLLIGVLLSAGGLVIFGFNDTKAGTRLGAIVSLTGLCVLWVAITAVGIEKADERRALEPTIANWASGPGATPALQWPEGYDSWAPALQQHCIKCHENNSN